MFKAIYNLFGRIGNVFQNISNLDNPSVADDYKKKVRTVTPGRRQFNYLGVDNKLHMVRIGSAFPVRPLGYPFTYIATETNRGWLKV